jgi:DNA-binding LacI/PurR family transcriptional regulator
LKKITIKDIAEIAGVSVSTVSRVLNEKGNVDDSLRERVLNAIRETGFQPSKFARQFRKRITQVHVAIPIWEEPYLRVLDGLIEAFEDKEIFVSVGKSTEDSVADIVVLISDKDNCEGKINITVGSDFDNCSVVFDYFHAYKELTDFFLKNGKRSYTLLSTGLKDYKTCKLYAAFLKAMFHGGIEDYDVILLENEGDFLNKFSRLSDVVFCVDDVIAVRLIEALKIEGVRIPEEVSIVGHGNLTISQLVIPSLTTVEYFNRSIGKMCASVLLKILNGEKVPKRIVYKGQVIKRESSI